tara:strand:- start:50073 stop:50516 length:444 start_codon:yes stop_codon:yes gene_type:complete
MSNKKMTSQRITFHRKGYFISNKHSSTQCTVEGWRGYKYKATIMAACKFDENGFLIDHNEVHNAITNWVDNNNLPSCETTLQILCGVIARLLLDYGVDLWQLGMEIVPVDHKLLKTDNHGTLEPIDKKSGELLQAMPANAEYWCKFY